MLLKSKRLGASSTAGGAAKKGYAGRLELFAERHEDGSFRILFRDVGNYNRDRWGADFGPLTAEDLLALSAQLQAVASGQVQSTAASAEQVAALVASVTPAEETEVAETAEGQVAPEATETLTAGQ